jgi:hypothetical protein
MDKKNTRPTELEPSLYLFDAVAVSVGAIVGRSVSSVNGIATDCGRLECLENQESSRVSCGCVCVF